LPGNVQLVDAGFAINTVIAMDDGDWNLAVANESTPLWL
jgi:hypothetical protein